MHTVWKYMHPEIEETVSCNLKPQTVRIQQLWSCPHVQAWCKLGEPHSDDPVGAMASPNAVETLQEADEAIQQHPVPTATHPSTCSLSINIPVPLSICHPPSPSSWQQEEASPPELQRVNQTGEAEERKTKVFDLDAYSFPGLCKKIKQIAWLYLIY